MFKRLLPILALSFVNVLGYGILIPVLPDMVGRFSEVQYPGLVYGSLISFYALSQFLAAPVFGSLSDRFGRRPLLLISQFGTMLSWVVFGLAYFFGDIALTNSLQLGLVIIIFSRIIDGITGGNASVAQAWIADMTTPEERTRAFGLEGAIFGIGFLIGPVLGGFSYSTKYHLLGTAVVAFLISLATFILMFKKLPESLPVKSREPQVVFSWKDELKIFNKMKVLWSQDCLKKLMPLRLSFALLFVCFTTALILFLERDYQLTPVEIGLTMMVFGCFSIFNQAYLIPQLSKAISNVRIFLLAALVIAIGFITLPAVPYFLGLSFGLVVAIFFFLNGFLINFGITGSMTIFRSLITILLPKNKHGVATGVNQSIMSLGQSIAPFIAGALYDIVTYWSFLLYGSLLLIPILIAKIQLNKKQLEA